MDGQDHTFSYQDFGQQMPSLAAVFWIVKRWPNMNNSNNNNSFIFYSAFSVTQRRLQWQKYKHEEGDDNQGGQAEAAQQKTEARWSVIIDSGSETIIWLKIIKRHCQCAFELKEKPLKIPE